MNRRIIVHAALAWLLVTGAARAESVPFDTLAEGRAPLDTTSSWDIVIRGLKDLRGTPGSRLWRLLPAQSLGLDSYMVVARSLGGRRGGDYRCSIDDVVFEERSGDRLIVVKVRERRPGAETPGAPLTSAFHAVRFARRPGWERARVHFEVAPEKGAAFGSVVLEGPEQRRIQLEERGVITVRSLSGTTEPGLHERVSWVMANLRLPIASTEAGPFRLTLSRPPKPDTVITYGRVTLAAHPDLRALHETLMGELYPSEFPIEGRLSLKDGQAAIIGDSAVYVLDAPLWTGEQARAFRLPLVRQALRTPAGARVRAYGIVYWDHHRRATLLPDRFEVFPEAPAPADDDTQGIIDFLGKTR